MPRRFDQVCHIASNTEEKQDEITSAAILVSSLASGATNVDVAMLIVPTTYGRTIAKDNGDRHVEGFLDPHEFGQLMRTHLRLQLKRSLQSAKGHVQSEQFVAIHNN